MRIRHLLAAGGLAVAAIVLPAWAASAQEDHGAEPAETVEATEESVEHDFANHAAEECVHMLEDGKTVDDCQKSPSVLMPETNEVIWGGGAFLVVLIGLSRIALPALKKSLNDRTERIRESIDEADSLKAEAAATLAQYQASVADAKAEAARIVDEARQDAEKVRADLIARAEAEVNELKAKGREDVEAGKARAITELQAQVGDLTIALAEKVVERSLDDATNRQLIDNYINNLGTNN
jgi:F-type H+-transporting ATPase subunit b